MEVNRLNQRLNEYLEQNRDSIVKSLQEFLRIQSVGTVGAGQEVDDSRGEPFGPGVSKSLEYVVELSQNLDLKSENFSNYATHTEIGQGEEILGILTHADVVPAGADWTYPAFSGTIADDKIFGRGTLDDKGPTIATLYALKAVAEIAKEEGVDLTRRARLIVGGDEETAWRCMDHYFSLNEQPAFGFSPDAEFPVVNAEKGILTVKLKKQRDNETKQYLIELRSGERVNMVPDRAQAILKLPSTKQEILVREIARLQESHRATFSIERDNNHVKIMAKGVSAHAMAPEKGINAGAELLLLLSILATKPELSDIMAEPCQAEFIATKIGFDSTGKGLGIACSDEISGSLTVNLGLMDITRDQAELAINIRYPVTKDANELINSIKETVAPLGFEISEHRDQKPLYVPEDHELIKTLTEVYTEYTGKEATLLSIGGGTYSRVLRTGVAFGPLFPGQEELAHQKDEYIGIDHLLDITKLYAQTIWRFLV